MYMYLLCVYVYIYIPGTPETDKSGRQQSNTLGASVVSMS